MPEQKLHKQWRRNKVERLELVAHDEFKAPSCQPVFQHLPSSAVQYSPAVAVRETWISNTALQGRSP